MAEGRSCRGRGEGAAGEAGDDVGGVGGGRGGRRGQGEGLVGDVRGDQCGMEGDRGGEQRHQDMPAQPEQRYGHGREQIRGADDPWRAETVHQAAGQRRHRAGGQSEETEEPGGRGRQTVGGAGQQQRQGRPQCAPGAEHARLPEARPAQVGRAAQQSRQLGQTREQPALPCPPLRRQGHGGGQAQRQGQYGGPGEHPAPAEDLPGQAADDAGGHDAGEQSGDDGRDMPGAPVRGGALGDQRDQQLRYDGRGGGEEHGGGERGGARGRGGGDQRHRGGHGQAGDERAAVDAVAERGEEEQAGRVAELGDGRDPGHRRGDRAEVVGDQGEQRGREVDVGGGDGRTDGDEQEEQTAGCSGGPGLAGRGGRRGPIGRGDTVADPEPGPVGRAGAGA